MSVFQWVKNKLKVKKLVALNDAARKAQGTKDDKLTDAERQAITRDFFLSSGLDFKGQSQCCFEAKGAEVGVEVEVDPLMLLLGVFSTHMTVRGNAGLTDKVLIIAQVGPPKILSYRGEYEVPFPYLLNTCGGYSWSGGVSADIFIGVGVTAGISFDMEVAGKDFSAEAKVEAKAGLTANAGFTARHYYAEDYAPKVFADRCEAREGLKDLLDSGGNNKDYFKTQAANLVNKNPLRTGIKSLLTPFGFSDFRSSERFYRWLDAFIADPSSTQGMKDQALILKNNLKFIKGNIKPVISSCIRITDYCGEGGVELTASASAAANACGLVGASVEASAKACANGSYKPVTVRSQAVYPAFLRTDTNPITRFVVMTQDTRILYEKYDLSLSVAASAEIGGLGEKSEPLAKVEGNKELKRNLNRMTYITTVVYWASPVPWPQSNINSGIGKTDSLEGSGICFGGSYQLKDLAKYSKTRALVPEPLQPLWILNTLENNVDKADAAPTDEARYDAELSFDTATLVSANAFNGTLESARGYDSSGDEEEEFNKHADSKFNGSKGHSVMPTLIGQALADYERQTKAIFSSQSAGSTRAKGILKKMVDDNDPKLGDTVAWLIGEYSGDAAIDTAQFHNETLNKVGGARGFFSQKSKGKTEGRLYGLLKAKYAEAIIQDGQAAELFRQQENQFKSNEALYSQLLETRNKGVRDGNQASRTNFEAAEKVRVDGVNQESINQYTVNEAARVRAENKKIRDSFDTKQAEIQASNKAKKDEFIKKQEYIENKNALKIAMKKDIEEINKRIEIENQRYKEIYKANKFADPAHMTINYDRYSPTKVNFDDLEKKNAIIIETNKGIMARNEIEQKKWDAEYQYFKLLAANLHVSCQDLETFFASGDMKSWMEGVEDLLAMGETVLLESTFSHSSRITMISTSKDQKQKLIELEPKTAELMLESFKYIDVDKRKLESIRMRWRIQDMANSSSNYFKLGISVFNQGGTIALKKIDEAGSEGIVDLCTVFFGDLQEVPEESYEYVPDRAARLEKAVPPTVLYCL